MARGGAEELSPVCGYIAERTGSSLSPQQVSRLKEAISRKLGALSDRAALEFLKSKEGALELAELMSVIAVHKTDLFRDEVQLRAFETHVLRPLVQSVQRPLRLWSAGCATGEEVATLLVLLAEAGADPNSTVLATDMSSAALAQAKAQTFHPDLFKRVPPPLREKYFQAKPTGHWQLKDELRERAHFLRHNLMDFPYPAAPAAADFDVIFCRNVLIYFTELAFDRTVAGLTDRLCPGGTLVLSAAEPILRRQPRLSTVRCDQAFFYVRTPTAGDGSLGRVRALMSPPAIELPAASRGVRPPESPQPVNKVGSVPRAVEAQRQPPEDPLEEATRLFQLVLDWAANGEPDAQTEKGLRKCLYLDPHLAQARYLLGVLLEQRGEKADAASEFRRALAALTEGKARSTPFFLNNERLKAACTVALRRQGYQR